MSFPVSFVMACNKCSHYYFNIDNSKSCSLCVKNTNPTIILKKECVQCNKEFYTRFTWTTKCKSCFNGFREAGSVDF